MPEKNTTPNGTNKIIYFVFALLIISAASFYGGLRYGRSQGGGLNVADLQKLPPAERRQKIQDLGLFGSGNGSGFTGRAGGRNGAGNDFTSGEIISRDDKSITVKSQDGGSKIIFLSGSTEITKSTTGTPADLAAGKNVTVNGSANPDGSITARSIQLRALPPAPRQ